VRGHSVFSPVLVLMVRDGGIQSASESVGRSAVNCPERLDWGIAVVGKGVTSVPPLPPFVAPKELETNGPFGSDHCGIHRPLNLRKKRW